VNNGRVAKDVHTDLLALTHHGSPVLLLRNESQQTLTARCSSEVNTGCIAHEIARNRNGCRSARSSRDVSSIDVGLQTSCCVPDKMLGLSCQVSSVGHREHGVCYRPGLCQPRTRMAFPLCALSYSTGPEIIYRKRIPNNDLASLQ